MHTLGDGISGPCKVRGNVVGAAGELVTNPESEFSFSLWESSSTLIGLGIYLGNSDSVLSYCCARGDEVIVSVPFVAPRIASSPIKGGVGKPDGSWWISTTSGLGPSGSVVSSSLSSSGGHVAWADRDVDE